MLPSKGMALASTEKPQRPAPKRMLTKPTQRSLTKDWQSKLNDTRGAVFLSFAISQAGTTITKECMLWPTPKRVEHSRSKSDDNEKFYYDGKTCRQFYQKHVCYPAESSDVPNLHSLEAQNRRHSLPFNRFDFFSESIKEDDANGDYINVAPSIAIERDPKREVVQHLPKLVLRLTIDGASDVQDEVGSGHLWKSRRNTPSLEQDVNHRTSMFHPVRSNTDSDRGRSIDRGLVSGLENDGRRSHFTNPFSDSKILPVCRKFSDFESASETSLDPFPRRPPLQRTSKCSCETNTSQNSSSGSDEVSIPHHDAFQGHRDTLALINYRKRTPLQIPEQVFKALPDYLSFEDYKSLRRTSKQWLLSLPAPTLPTSFNIPREILQAVYHHLSPHSFDAARHTCKSWFLASLDKTLLLSIGHQGACEQAIDEDIRRHQANREAQKDSLEHRRSLEHANCHSQDCHQENIDDDISEEWVISKRLATEARISRGWHGLQLRFSMRGSPPSNKSMNIVEEVDFTTLVQDRVAYLSSDIKITGFNVSSCTRFVLLNSGLNLHVYRFGETAASFIPVTTLPFQKRILQVSMDTSSQRYTVAVLLEDRAGMCWDLGIGISESLMNADDTTSQGVFTSVHSAEANPIGAITSRRAEFPSAPDYFADHGQANAFFQRSSPLDDHFQPDLTTYPSQDRKSLWSTCSEPSTYASTLVKIHSAMVYEHLGSPDDEPRSVAICPQRKCVAFGCRMGIELHWQDALTGGDLHRWFPLAAPSDHLHFLPHRPGIDSNKKLRLISSAAGPHSNSNSSQRGTVPSGWTQNQPSEYVRPEPHQRRQTMTRLFFGNLPFPEATTTGGPSQISTNPTHPMSDDRLGILRTVDCDHYQAIPLSDGAHVLFTDPASGLLCLGSDAPLGGPTKLLRKFVLVPGKYHAGPSRARPITYAAGRELRWGIRIVAFYADGSLMLFNIPVDLFNKVRYSRSRPDVWDEQIGNLAQSDLMMDAVMDQQPDQDLPHLNTSSRTSIYNNESEQEYDGRRFRSIKIHGVKIADVNDYTTVEELAVKNEHGGLKVWVFHADGIARCFDIYTPWDCRINHRKVLNDGSLDDSIRNQPSATAGILGAEIFQPHVHFAELDGTNEMCQHPDYNLNHHQEFDYPGRSATLEALPKQALLHDLHPVEDIDYLYPPRFTLQRNTSLVASNQRVSSDWPCDEEFISCLAYKRMVFANMGIQRGTLGGVPSSDSVIIRAGDGLKSKKEEKESNRRAD